MTDELRLNEKPRNYPGLCYLCIYIPAFTSIFAIRIWYLHPERPSRTILSFHELIRFIEIGDLHIFGIPQQLLAAGIIFFISDGIAAQGEVAHEHGFCKWSGVFK